MRFALRHDRRGALRFAPLQGVTAARLLGHQDGPRAAELSTVVVIVAPGTPEQRVLRRSAAILRMAHELGGAWRLAAVFRLVPACVRDFVYDRVAAVRYRIFGRRQACMVPEDKDRARFLD